MKIVYSWLKDFVDIDVPVEELADALTGCGLEVASIEHRAAPEGIVAAKVLDVQKHPNADRLSVCSVDAGGNEQLTIVCGAPNVVPDMNVALATIGTQFSPDFVIKKTKLRGVTSHGMLCSEKELGISDDHSGLMQLPDDSIPGKPFSNYFPPETIIEIELTPDRGDCLSVLGVAREIAATYNLPLKDTAQHPREESDETISDSITVTIDASDRCPRYTGRLVRSVTIGPSPQWLQTRLTLAGIHPINNIVDITNYMLLHFGQPMHAFDYALIQGKKIGVRTAGNEQIFTTLDSIDRQLTAEDLLITDGSHPVALAGIMGGAGSEINENTTDVFLECAYFEPIGIRKTGKRLGLSTDSSYRFERGVDPEKSLEDALDTAAALLELLAGGTTVKDVVDVYPTPLQKKTITLRPEKVCRVLGTQIVEARIVSFLTSLQITCTKQNDGTLLCTVPLFRHDITIEEDLIEEVGRLFGYDNITPSETMHLSLLRSLPERERITDTIRHALAFSGLQEVVTNSMTSRKKCSVTDPDTIPVELLNPLNPEMACMRPSLIGSLLDITAYNCNRKNRDNRFFEFGKTYRTDASGKYIERTVIAILLEGNLWNATWNSSAMKISFYALKGIIEAFCSHIGFTDIEFSAAETAPVYFSDEVAYVRIGSLIHGFAGMVSGNICKKFDIKSDIAYAQLDITDLLTSTLPQKQYTPLPKYPALERDFSFVFADTVSSSSITETVSSLSPLIESVYPFDVFRGDKLGAGKKSITFSIAFRSPDKTLTDNDVESICDQIIDSMEKTFQGELRS